MTFHFTPQRLIEATARLVQAHPVSQTHLSDPVAVIASHPHVLNALREKVRHTPHDQLESLVPQLDALERIVLPFLHTDRSEDIRQKVIEIVESNPKLADMDRLLQSFILFPTSIEIGQLSRLAYRLNISRNTLSPPWKSILISKIKHDSDFAEEMVMAITDKATPIEIFMNEAIIPDASPLGTLLNRAVLSVGPNAWSIHGINTALRAFGIANLTTRLHAYSMAKLSYDANENISILSKFCIESMGVFNGDLELQERLRKGRPDIWRWLQDLFLESFFNANGDAHNRERYLFWRRYIDPAKQIQLNPAAGRFFLEFEKFGVVDFLQTGNALYIYDRARLRSLMEFDKTDQATKPNGAQKHAFFKDKATCIGRWSHVGDWQAEFRDSLLKLGIAPS